MAKKTYSIISPDGFSINMEGSFKTKKEANEYFEQWQARYKPQGYYSSNKGRISLVDLKDNCTFVENN